MAGIAGWLTTSVSSLTVLSRPFAPRLCENVFECALPLSCGGADGNDAGFSLSALKLACQDCECPQCLRSLDPGIYLGSHTLLAPGVTVHIAPISAQFASSSASSLGLPLEARSTYFVVASDARLFPDFPC